MPSVNLLRHRHLLHRPLRDSGRQRTRLARGQSLVEFALILPIMLTLLLAGVDFGRAFLGWVELNNVVREAANFAADNPTGWSTGNSGTAQAEYTRLVTADAARINCTLPSPLPAPSFPNGPDGQNLIGTPATVSITCNFKLLTPFIGDIVGNTIHITASAAFPIRNGVIMNIPVGSVIPTASPTPSPSPSPSSSPSSSPSPSPSPSPTPAMCTVPDLTKFKADQAQSKWEAAGFTQPVLFNPLTNPTKNANVISQTIAAETSSSCSSTGITVTWQ
jgi:TadE-like protein